MRKDELSHDFGLNAVKSKMNVDIANVATSAPFRMVLRAQGGEVMRSMLTLVALLLAGSAAHAAGYKAMQSFDCTYVSRAFEDERNHRKTLSPVPDPQALTTLPTCEIAYFVGGYLTAWSAVGSI